MSDILAQLLRIDWVAVARFLAAVVVLLFVGAICSMFMSKSPVSLLPMEPPPSITPPDLKFYHPQRRKHDRANR